MTHHNGRFLKFKDTADFIKPASAGGSQSTIAQDLKISTPLPVRNESGTDTGETFYDEYNFALEPMGFVIKPGMIMNHSDGHSYKILDVEDWSAKLNWLKAKRETHA